MRAHFLQTRREALELSQGQLAERLGVAREVYGRWERGDACVPSRHRKKLAGLLELDESDLTGGASAGHKVLPGPLVLARPRARWPYPLGGTLDEVARLGTQACAILRGAREERGDVEVQRLDKHFARDTRHELLLALTLLAFGARLVWTSPQRLGCPLLVMDDFRCEYAGDHWQWAILWELEGEIIVVFGQQRLKSMFAKNRARVDFLVYHKPPRRRGQWMTVELDGREHETQEAQDDERAESLLVPEIRYDNKKLLSDHWFHRFLEDVRRASEEAARRQDDRNKKSDGYRKEREDERKRRAEQMQP